MSEPEHGKYSTYSNHKCRCPACTEAWRIYCKQYYADRPQQRRHKREAEVARRAKMGSVDVAELKPCSICGQLLQEFSLHNTRVHGIEPDHGTRQRYVRGCKCDLCRAASAAERRAYRQRAKERS